MMDEVVFIDGNEAVGWGALAADCDAFFGYPITPQNNITEWFAREFPKRGRVFVQTSSEVASINWLYGGASVGKRVITSTSSPGWALMQETLSHMANTEVPCVIVLVQRGGPGQGTTRHAQMDYTSATQGGGNGGYKNIVLAPYSAQEAHDLVQLAFYLADKYINPAIVLSDGIIGTTLETVILKKMEFEKLPEKNWALRGKGKQKDKKRRVLSSAQGLVPTLRNPSFVALQKTLFEKYSRMQREEIRYETHQLEDAELVLVAYGYCARVSMEAMSQARDIGLKVGMIRPITLWPFPYQPVKEQAKKGNKILVVEDSLGQMLMDVKMACDDRTEIGLVSCLDRHEAMEGGAIYPEKILDKIQEMIT
ncbi:MAG: 3-methyl-2-oxobutanoate dehydrogenase subunit VorB [Thermodesulfobacteriota bacterium]|nr:3-methyl-2-oxobutanoate dehydrogenase subunit VorB [Thermodesulfobacteriota bacterium]